MKKARIAGLLMVLFSALPAFATSGACSYHGGVNCYAGPVIQGGYAVCSDGTESSVLYGDMVECQPYFCTSQSQVTAYQAQLGGAQISSYQTGSYRSSSGSSMVSYYQQELNQCEDQYQDYLSYVRNSPSTNSTGAGPIYYRGCPEYARRQSDGSCACDDGWVMSKNRCVPDDKDDDVPTVAPTPAPTPTVAPAIIPVPAMDKSIAITKVIATPKLAATTTTATTAPQVIEVPIAPTVAATATPPQKKSWWGRVTAFFVNIF